MLKPLKYLTICVMLLNPMQSFSHGDNNDGQPPETPVPFEEEYFNVSATQTPSSPIPRL